MGKLDTTKEQQPTTRHYLRVVAFVVFVLSFTVWLMFGVYPHLQAKPLVVINDQPQPELLRDEISYSLPREFPTRIRIPKIHVDASFGTPLELSADHTIEVPKSFDRVGWYRLGAAPGEKGTAAVLGHVDSHEGPAVFFALGQVVPGDSIFITRADGTEAEFAVEYFERYKQEEFPAEKVYTPTAYASLRLITCTGVYKKGEQRYTHNLVVYARLVEPKTAE